MRYIVHLFDGQVLAMTFLLLGGVTILVYAMYGLCVELTIFITKVRLTATNYYPTMGTDPIIVSEQVLPGQTQVSRTACSPSINYEHKLMSPSTHRQAKLASRREAYRDLTLGWEAIESDARYEARVLR